MGPIKSYSLGDAIGRTPLVKLQFEDCPVPIYGKCEFMNPTGSVKDRLAKALIHEGEASGRLRPGDTIVEATAGNTGMGLAMLAASKGYRLVCVMPQKMSVDKRRSLEAMGAEVMVVPDAPLDSPENFRQTADRLAADRGWFLANQFRSPANVSIHETETGPEIWADLDGKIGAFVAGVGTGGTITGVSRCLKSFNRNIQIVLADPRGSSLAHWVRTGEYGPSSDYTVEGIGSSRASDILRREAIDSAETVSDEESYAMTLELQRRHGLLVGGSSGTAVVAALRVARAGITDLPVVALLADSWDRYFSQPWMKTTAAQPSPV